MWTEVIYLKMGTVGGVCEGCTTARMIQSPTPEHVFTAERQPGF